MNRKRSLMTVILLAGALATSSVMADRDRHGGSAYEYADVVEALPVYRQVQVSFPREECWNERVPTSSGRRSHDSRTPELVSSVIGGAIGNAVGTNKSSRRVGAVVGAVLGHSIGRDIVAANSRSSDEVRYRTVRQCETYDEYRHEERLVGYDVRYRYQGREYSVRTDHDPGSRIRVRVHVEPVL